MLSLELSLARAGHSVVMLSRTPGKPGVKDAAGQGAIGREDIDDADVVILALPFPEIVRFASRNKVVLAGKTIIDPSGPFDYLSDGQRGSSELVADALGGSAGLVAAFKDATPEELLPGIHAGTLVRDIRLAADDPVAMAVVASLVRDIGCNPVDCGPLRNSRLLDAAASLVQEIARRARHSRTNPVMR